MTKEEYEKALNSFCNNCKYGYDCKIMKKYNSCVQMNTLNQLIKEHFELFDKLNEMERTINSLDYELNDIYHSQPYKFEQLKTNLTVFDKALKELVFIGVMCGKHILNNTVPYFGFGDEELYTVNFEENRFYPVTKALEYQK